MPLRIGNQAVRTPGSGHCTSPIASASDAVAALALPQRGRTGAARPLARAGTAYLRQ